MLFHSTFALPLVLPGSSIWLKSIPRTRPKMILKITSHQANHPPIRVLAPVASRISKTYAIHTSRGSRSAYSTGKGGWMVGTAVGLGEPSLGGCIPSNRRAASSPEVKPSSWKPYLRYAPANEIGRPGLFWMVGISSWDRRACHWIQVRMYDGYIHVWRTRLSIEYRMLVPIPSLDSVFFWLERRV